MTQERWYELAKSGPMITEEDFAHLQDFHPKITEIARCLVHAFGGRYLAQKHDAAHG